MPCQLAPWEIEIEQRWAQQRRRRLVEDAFRDADDPRVRRRLQKLASESTAAKAERATRELCAAWRMLFAIVDADDPAAAARQVAESTTLTRHRVYREAHRIGDEANLRGRRAARKSR